MKFELYADTHIFSPIENIGLEEIMKIPKDDNTLFLGDIFDLASVEKSQAKKLLYYHDLFKHKHGENFIRGNHCRTTIENETVIKTTESGVRICFAHGDIEANPERWIKYRQKPHGAGFFKRKFIIPFIREAEEIIERNPKRKVLDRMCAKAYSLHCDVYVCGHFHSKEKLELSHFYLGKTYKIIIVPRGKTELEIE